MVNGESIRQTQKPGKEEDEEKVSWENRGLKGLSHNTAEAGVKCVCIQLGSCFEKIREDLLFASMVDLWAPGKQEMKAKATMLVAWLSVEGMSHRGARLQKQGKYFFFSFWLHVFMEISVMSLDDC